jgi:hypothetical protein
VTNDTRMRQIMQECFDGTRYRNCTNCPAHHKQPGGICCFGHRYEDDDDSCRACPYSHQCRQETFAWSAQKSSHVFKTSSSQYIRPNSSSSSKPNEPLIKNNENNRSGFVKTETTEQSFAKQLGIRALWGAVEGSLEMILGFFRTKRPF